MTVAPPDVVLRSAHLLDGEVVDVSLAEGAITDVQPADPRPAAGDAVDLSGYLLLPAPAEPHAHLDKVLTADLLPNREGDLDGAVAAWYGYRQQATESEVLERARRAAMMFVQNGATAVRTHVDVGAATGSRLLEPLLALRAELRALLDLQVVAMVDVPVTGPDGAANRAELDVALELGADAVGGAPYRDPDPRACQRLLLEVASTAGVPVDLHTDETLDANVLTLASLPGQCADVGLAHQVVASHCVSLGMQPVEVSRTIAAALAGAQVAVVACPATNLYLQARAHQSRAPRGLTAVATLEAAGVLLAAGGDNIADPFYPLGRADPLDTAAMMVAAGHLTPDRAYAAVSTRARRAMGLVPAEVTPGAPAELLAIRASSLRAALADPLSDRIVFRRGQIVSSTRILRSGSNAAELRRQGRTSPARIQEA
jgi:cytosine deaminase